MALQDQRETSEQLDQQVILVLWAIQALKESREMWAQLAAWGHKEASALGEIQERWATQARKGCRDCWETQGLVVQPARKAIWGHQEASG